MYIRCHFLIVICLVHRLTCADCADQYQFFIGYVTIQLHYENVLFLLGRHNVTSVTSSFTRSVLRSVLRKNLPQVN